MFFAATIALFVAAFSPSLFAAQPPTRATPTPTPTYRPSSTPPVYRPKTPPAPTGTPIMKPPAYTWATAETLTSVTQVTDIEPTDFGYKELKLLIEKYGIAGLTEGRKLMPDQNLSPAAYRTIRQSAVAQLRQIASKIGMPAKRFDELFITNCPEPKAIADVMTAGEVVNSLKCIFGPASLSSADPDKPMTRGFFILVLDDAVENGSRRIASNSRLELGPTKTPGNPAEIKALIEQGQRLINAQDYDGAIRLFNQVLDYDREYVDAYRFRGLAALLGYQKNPNDRQKLYTAQFNFDDVVKRNAAVSDDYYLRGLTHIGLGSKEKAVADFRSALRMNPNHQGAKNELMKLGVSP